MKYIIAIAACCFLSACGDKEDSAGDTSEQQESADIEQFLATASTPVKVCHAILAQLVEQRFCKPQVISSSLINGYSERSEQNILILRQYTLHVCQLEHACLNMQGELGFGLFASREPKQKLAGILARRRTTAHCACYSYLRRKNGKYKRISYRMAQCYRRY